jgi:5-methylcytosine-specific restriction endonuclease McrA
MRTLPLLIALAQPAEDYQGVPIALEEGADTYDRDLYEHWSDVDDDDQDTRQEVLIEESLIAVTFDADGEVSAGLWVCPYTGRVLTDPGELEIDHVIPLKETYISGAHGWNADHREDFANDLGHSQALIAVLAGSNSSKGSRDPASWLPPSRSYWCQYLSDWIAIKLRSDLTMDADEKAAIETGQQVCGEYRVGDKLEGRH